MLIPKMAAYIAFPAAVGRYSKLDRVKSQVCSVQRYGAIIRLTFPM
jgi:hypothetical protein